MVKRKRSGHQDRASSRNYRRILAPSTTELSGARCHAWMWIRFNPRRTANENGAELFRDQILNRIVNYAVAPGLPHYALIDHLAADAEAPVTIERVSEELFGFVLLTGRTYFGFLGSILDRMVENYDGLEWWVSDKGLNIGPPLMTPLSEFDRLAARASPFGIATGSSFPKVAVRDSRSKTNRPCVNALVVLSELSLTWTWMVEPARDKWSIKLESPACFFLHEYYAGRLSKWSLPNQRLLVGYAFRAVLGTEHLYRCQCATACRYQRAV